MRFKLISDNTDTLVGMRLAGIKGVMAQTLEEVKKAVNDAIKIEDVAIVLVTKKLMNRCSEFLSDLKSTSKRPLIVDIPDGNSPDSKKDSITKYIRDAIGLKI